MDYGHRDPALLPAGRRRRDRHRGGRAVPGEPARRVPRPEAARGGGRHAAADAVGPAAAHHPRRQRLQAPRRHGAARPRRRSGRRRGADRPGERQRAGGLPAVAGDLARSRPDRRRSGPRTRGSGSSSSTRTTPWGPPSSRAAGSTSSSPPGGRATPTSSGPGCSPSRCAWPSRRTTPWPSGTRSRWPRPPPRTSCMLGPEWELRTLSDELCAQAGFAPRVVFEEDDIPVVRGFVAAGLGVSIVPALPAEVPPAVGGAERLVRLTDPGAFRDVGLAWSKSRRLLPSAELFRRHVLQDRHERLAVRSGPAPGAAAARPAPRRPPRRGRRTGTRRCRCRSTCTGTSRWRSGRGRGSYAAARPAGRPRSPRSASRW